MSIHDEVHARLVADYGPQNWPPSETPLEALMGAVLAQGAARRSVEQALVNLREAGMTSVEAMDRMSVDELGELIRPAGHVRLKSRRLKNLARFLIKKYDGSLEALAAASVDTLREQLLALNGVGPETADSVLLYAAHKPTFVVDAGAARILKRHGWIEFEADYFAIREDVEAGVEPDPLFLHEYHVLLARIGSDHCRKTPRCETCPLRDLLPDGGPLEAEWW